MTRFVLICVLAVSMWGQVSTVTTYAPAPVYLFASFSSPRCDLSTPASTFQLYYSQDAKNFQFGYPVAPSIGTRLRDPSIARVGTELWMAYTTCNLADAYHIGVTKSTDNGLTWAAPTLLDLSVDVPGATFAWAPEWAKTDSNTTYIDGGSNVYLAISITTQADPSNCCFSIYLKTTTDLVTWTAASAITLTGIGTANPIDPFLVRSAGTWYAWFKSNDQTGWLSPGYATGGAAITDAYTVNQTGQTDWAGFPQRFEGPALLRTVAGSPGTWRLYADNYTAGAAIESGNVRWSESTNGFAGPWSAVTYAGCPVQCKQGTVIPY